MLLILIEVHTVTVLLKPNVAMMSSNFALSVANLTRSRKKKETYLKGSAKIYYVKLLVICCPHYLSEKDLYRRPFLEGIVISVMLGFSDSVTLIR